MRKQILRYWRYFAQDQGIRIQTLAIRLEREIIPHSFMLTTVCRKSCLRVQRFPQTMAPTLSLGCVQMNQCWELLQNTESLMIPFH